MSQPQREDSLVQQLMEIITSEDGALRQALELILNQVMLLERERYLKAEAYERNSERTGYANGFKSKKLKTRTGN